MERTYIDCPRAKSDMTPCVARDGDTAITNDGSCVGCGEHPSNLLKDVVRKYIDSKDRIDELEQELRSVLEMVKHPRRCEIWDSCPHWREHPKTDRETCMGTWGYDCLIWKENRESEKAQGTSLGTS